MNERIKELVEQAVKSVDIVTGNELLDDELAKMYIPDCFAEKFAELLIRECMNTIKQNENASLNISNFTDEKKQGIQLGLEFAITDIAEHFGVEE